MSNAPEPAVTEVEAARQRDLVVLLIAVAAAVVLSRVLGSITRSGGIPSPILQVLAADAVVWIPLVVGAGWVLRRASRPAAIRRLRIDVGDVVFAIGIVIVCRGVDAFLSLSISGTTGLSPAPTLGPPDVGLLLASAIGVCLVSPALEELVFRGLFQRRLADALTPRTRILAVPLTAFLFALVHVLIGSPASSLIGFEVFFVTFLLGLCTGSLVAMTGRIGGAILAHVLFNTVAVVLTWPR